MYFNNGMGYNNGMMNYGYNRPKMPNPTNPLTQDELNLLKQKAPQFSLAVSQVDALKAICTHRDKNGEQLIQNPDGSVTCALCGTTFTPIQANEETINEIFKTAVDCLETIKIMYMDIPDDVTKAYFQMTPYLQKAPQLYKIANDHYQRYNNSQVISGQYNNNGGAFNLFAQMMNPGMMAGMGMPYAQPGAAPQQQYQQGGVMPFQPQQFQQGMQQQNTPDVTMGSMQNGVNPFDVSSSPVMEAAKAPTVTDNKKYSL